MAALPLLLRTAAGLVLFGLGLALSFRQPISWRRETAGDLVAVAGLIMMIAGLIIIFLPLLEARPTC